MKQEFYIILHHSCGEIIPLDTAYSTYQEAEDAVLDELAEVVNEHIGLDDKKMEALIKEERKNLREMNYASYDFGEFQEGFEIHKVHLSEQEAWSLTDKELEEHHANTIKKQKVTRKKVNGFYPKKFIEGFFDPFNADNAAHRVLSAMDMPDDILPFNVEELLQTGSVTWKDGHDNIVGISFGVENGVLICGASYPGKTTSNTIELDEYEDETPANKAKYISSDIGAFCVATLDEVFDYDKYPYPYLDGDE